MAHEKAEMEEQIARLQLTEQNLQQLVNQRQQFQMQIVEIDNAMQELEKSSGTVFKTIGPLMIAVEKKDLKKELTGKKEVLDIRIRSLEKQETSIREKAKVLQSHIVSKLEDQKTSGKNN